MKIEVVVNHLESNKVKGNLLEDLAKKFLESQNFEVTQNIRQTGVEIDLLCTHKANRQRSVYVECKAYNDSKKIDSSIITSMVGIKTIKKYPEAWLISTSEFGQDVKGIIEELKRDGTGKDLTFYSPDILIESLSNSRVIISYENAEQIIEGIVGKNKISDILLLVSEYGYFWVAKIKEGGKPSGAIFLYATNGEIVLENTLLKNLSEQKSSLESLDFFNIYAYRKNRGNSQIPVVTRLKKEYLKKTNDLGFKLLHPEKGNISLNDVFIFPDLEFTEKENNKIINSKELLDIGTKEGLSKVLIFGGDLSGKTSLAFKLQEGLSNRYLLPIYINSKEIISANLKNFDKLIIREFKKQYSENESILEKFKERLKARDPSIILLFDDFEQVKIRRKEALSVFLKTIISKFNKIIIFSDNSLEFETIASSETNAMFFDFKSFKLKQLGHVLRDEIIERWLTLGPKDTISDGELLSKKNEISNKINIAVGTNFLPTHPLYVLTILQIIISGSNKTNLQGSAYGELYSYLIDNALLSVNAKPDDLDFFRTYLSYVAHFFYTKDIQELPVGDMKELYDQYSQLMYIEKDFISVHRLLVQAKLLKEENGYYAFCHNYSYYFFIAKYLSDNLENQKIKVKISKIIRRLDLNKNANIIIFLIHHSKNKEIIDEIINESRKIFSKYSPHSLSTEELKDANDLISEELKIQIDDTNPKDYRKKVLEQKDEIEKENRESTSEKDEKNQAGLFHDISLSFKLIEILGQITNNYYGSLDGKKKTEILKELSSLGLRGLNAFFQDFEEYRDSVREKIAEMIEEKSAELKSEKEKIADEIIHKFIGLIVFVFIKKISESVSSKNLFPTLSKVKEDNQSPAYKLVDMAVKLNFFNELNIPDIIKLDSALGKNYLLKELLRILVAEHIYKFDVSISTKQKICSKLGIRFVPKNISIMPIHD